MHLAAKQLRTNYVRSDTLPLTLTHTHTSTNAHTHTHITIPSSTKLGVRKCRLHPRIRLQLTHHRQTSIPPQRNARRTAADVIRADTAASACRPTRAPFACARWDLAATCARCASTCR